MYRETGDLLVTRDLLRHESVATTEVYTALVVERSRDALLSLVAPSL